MTSAVTSLGVMMKRFVILALVTLSSATAPPAWADDARSSPAAMKNAGFESGKQDWSVHVYGKPSSVDHDERFTHEGGRSLRISAIDPSDTALGQELSLRPGHLYRFTGWVRTENLQTQSAKVWGTFQIQMPGGTGVIASGENHGGTTDWTRVAIDFEAPAGGLTRIAVFFAGYGTGTGTAWFDDLSLTEIDLSHAPLRITRDALPGKISPYQYGQFIEYLCDLVPGMWAEKLHDGSFEGLSPYKFAYLRQTDFREHPWSPYSAVNRAELTLDREQQISGEVSQRVNVPSGTPCTVGVAQDGIAVSDQVPCELSVFLRQTGLTRPVTIRLLNEATELAQADFQVTSEWTKFRATLTSEQQATNARLAITFTGPGTLWIDNASLMPVDNLRGWRKDVVAAVKALKPGIIRFGGSALDDASLGEFEWRDTIGDPDRRKPFRAWGGLQPTGPGLEEIVQFCQLVDAQPLICVRFSQKKPQDAAEQVEYFNGSIETPLGRLRAKNGHPEPYRIKFWQVGNERAGAEYEQHLAPICQAMLAADNSITLLSSYPTSEVINQAGRFITYVCPHHYDCANLAECERDLAATRRLIAAHDRKSQIKVAITEWNTTAGDWGTGRAKLWTLENALACSRYQNLMHRHADLVQIANRSNLVNSFCSGILQTDNHRLYKTPTYYAQWLYANYAGAIPLKVDSTFAVQTGPDVSATLSDDGSIVTLFAVNSRMESIRRPIDMSAFARGQLGQTLTIWTVADRDQRGEPDVTNQFGDPQRIVAKESTFEALSPQFDFQFPALSLTMLRWRVD